MLRQSIGNVAMKFVSSQAAILALKEPVTWLREISSMFRREKALMEDR